MNAVRCPTCGKPFDTATTDAMPFCCRRCQEIDLGRWLDEKNRVPDDLSAEPEPSEDDLSAEPPEDEA